MTQAKQAVHSLWQRDGDIQVLRLVQPSSWDFCAATKRNGASSDLELSCRESCRGAELCIEGGKAAQAWKTSKLNSPVNSCCFTKT